MGIFAQPLFYNQTNFSDPQGISEIKQDLHFAEVSEANGSKVQALLGFLEKFGRKSA